MAERKSKSPASNGKVGRTEELFDHGEAVGGASVFQPGHETVRLGFAEIGEAEGLVGVQPVAADFHEVFFLQGVDDLGRIGRFAAVHRQQDVNALGICVVFPLESLDQAGEQDGLRAGRHGTLPQPPWPQGSW